MIVLSDNDILFKLAHCDLLPLLPDFLGVDAKEIYILPSCIFKLRRVLKADAPVLARIESFCASATTVTEDAVDSETLTTLIDTGADPGEALLAATVSRIPDALLVTGDKRAIRALNKLPDGRLRDALARRIVCFESLVMGMMKTYGFDRLQPHFCAGVKCDALLNMAFGPGRSEEHALGCLRSYLADLETTSGWALKPV